MTFFLEMNPPTVTAQEHKVMVRHGRPMFYDTPRLKAARALYENALCQHKPDTPLDGALSLTVEWWFPSKSHREGEMRTTRPDTDNLQKLLKDCMTAEHFWTDDALVCSEITEKFWADTPGIWIHIEPVEG